MGTIAEMEPLFKKGEKIQFVTPDGTTRVGYYQGLARFGCCHRVTCKKSASSVEWILAKDATIKLASVRKGGAKWAS